jgi:hypothetical protein
MVTAGDRRFSRTFFRLVGHRERLVTEVFDPGIEGLAEVSGNGLRLQV